jgi:tetratricopeptide (TPR) repeat protein
VIERKCFNVAITFICGLVLACMFTGLAAAQDASQGKTDYTIQEYNAFQACRAEKDPTTQIHCLDDFVSKFPNSTLMQYVYQLYYAAYYQKKDYKYTIKYADMLAGLGDKIDPGTKFTAIQTHCQLFQLAADPKAADAHDWLSKGRDACLAAIAAVKNVKKPDTVSQDKWDETIKQTVGTDAASAGFVSLQFKEYDKAVEQLKLALQNIPTDAASEYRLGVAYLSMTPPQSLDGFWALGRAINMKVPDGDKVKSYLRQQVLTYEQPGCDGQVDAQLNELLQLTANPGDRPATYTIPSADDLHKISGASNILTVISDLSAGGDKAKMTWLAICGAEFPEIVGKVIDVQQNPDGSADFHVYTGATEDDMQAATTANMDVKVWITAPTTPPPATTPGGTPPQITPQPDVVRLQKDDGIRFSGTLVSYDPSPFLLHWDQVKVDPSVIPEKTESGKHPHKAVTKKTPQR